MTGTSGGDRLSNSSLQCVVAAHRRSRKLRGGKGPAPFDFLGLTLHWRRAKAVDGACGVRRDPRLQQANRHRPDAAEWRPSIALRLDDDEGMGGRTRLSLDRTARVTLTAQFFTPAAFSRRSRTVSFEARKFLSCPVHLLGADCNADFKVGNSRRLSSRRSPHRRRLDPLRLPVHRTSLYSLPVNRRTTRISKISPPRPPPTYGPPA